jgi:hypothetical protein
VIVERKKANADRPTSSRFPFHVDQQRSSQPRLPSLPHHTPASHPTLLPTSHRMISTETHLLPPLSPSCPSFLLHLTCLANSYLIWIGTSSSSNDVRPTTVKLGKEWSVAMPALASPLSIAQHPPPIKTLIQSNVLHRQEDRQ